jgi:hypothetical protein
LHLKRGFGQLLIIELFFLFFFVVFCTLEAALNFSNEAQEESRAKALPLHGWGGSF